MTTETYERANIRRWMLLLLNCFFFVGTFFTMFNWGQRDVNVWKFWKFISELQVRKTVALSDVAVKIGLRISVVFLVVFPILHVLKLLGLFGESRRNKAALSWLFSALELLGAIGVPTLYVYAALGGRSNLTPELVKELFETIATWAYVWIILIIIAMVLSIRLMPTPPVFKSLTSIKYKDIVCSDCGRKNPHDANFCLGCGKRFTENTIPSKWFCPICGAKNTATVSRCTSCGAYRPKEY
ncbi:MAG: zinc ribbon domain-containing protein [Lachnospiraceae bacterium]|nr:zinc ribbon domain-containing protein [Lachnospiraceae bacterium]